MSVSPTAVMSMSSSGSSSETTHEEKSNTSEEGIKKDTINDSGNSKDNSEFTPDCSKPCQKNEYCESGVCVSLNALNTIVESLDTFNSYDNPSDPNCKLNS